MPKFYQGREASTDPVFNAMEYLQVFPASPKKAIDVYGAKGVYLTDQERNDMLQTWGPKNYATMKKVVMSPMFSRLTPQVQQKVLKETMSSFVGVEQATVRAKAYKRLQSTPEGREAFKQKSSGGLGTTPYIFRRR
jgi:hypothetical protein